MKRRSKRELNKIYDPRQDTELCSLVSSDLSWYLNDGTCRETMVAITGLTYSQVHGRAEKLRAIANLPINPRTGKKATFAWAHRHRLSPWAKLKDTYLKPRFIKAANEAIPVNWRLPLAFHPVSVWKGSNSFGRGRVRG